MSVTFAAAARTFNAEFNADVIMAIPAADDLSVNMSNTNAARVCETLGIDLDDLGWCGSLPAADFLGRVLVALAVCPVDAGIPAHELSGTSPRWIECGRPEGYLQDRLGQLRELADWAVAHDAEIDFG
jgi:hypothetical protein